VVKPNTLTFINGLILATATGVAVHFYDRVIRLRDAVEYMVGEEIDADAALKAWSGEE
jgi:hypothetical protein